MQTQREILDEFLRFRSALGDTDQRKLAVLLLNRAYLNVWLAHPFNDHRLPAPIQVTTVANTRTYALPAYFGRIPPRVDYLRNVTTGAKLTLTPLDRLLEEHPASGTSLESAGIPIRAALAGPVGVSVQPSAAGQALEVVSDNASDTDVRVSVEGLNGDDEWDETQVTLTGTSAVAIGTWKDPIVNFSKAYPNGTTPATENTSSRGTVSLRVVSDSSVLGVLLPEESAREFPSLVLSPKPVTAGEIIAIPAIRAPKRLVYDADEVPRFWASAILEEMKALYQVSAGEIADDSRIQRTALARLVAHDNSGVEGRIRTRPFR
ncbi:MAG: hypothetical protein AB7O67_23205 [Vicinamibacterales bacterium]